MNSLPSPVRRRCPEGADEGAGRNPRRILSRMHPIVIPAQAGRWRQRSATARSTQAEVPRLSLRDIPFRERKQWLRRNRKMLDLANDAGHRHELCDRQHHHHALAFLAPARLSGFSTTTFALGLLFKFAGRCHWASPAYNSDRNSMKALTLDGMNSRHE